MWPRSVFGSRQNRSSNKSARAAKHNSSQRDVRRLFLEPLEDRRLLAFDLATSYLTGANPQAVATGHFNNDLILDIAVANQGSDNISLLLGDVGGTFQAAINSPTGAGPVSVAVGDFDEDGLLDLATANANSSDVSVLFGNGNGTFDEPVSINLGSNPASVAVGDFNSDGTLDLIATSNVQLPGYYYYGYYGGRYYSPGPINGYANVLLGIGGGSFAAPSVTDLGNGHHTTAAVADFNNDGTDDFATLNRDYGWATVLLGTASGALGNPASYFTGWYPQALTVGDFTSDGILDLATGGQTIDILPGLGNGTFRPVVRQYIDPVSLAAADFNGDGKLDLVSAEPYAQTVSVLLGLGTGSLTLPLDYAAGSQPMAVAVGDFNGDLRPDVVAANTGSGNISVLLNNGVWPALNAPTLRIADASVTEGNNGTTNISFNVTLSAVSSEPVSVHYTTANGSALAGEDYQSASGIVTIAPNTLSQPVTIQVNGDTLPELNEYFLVRLTDPTNAFIADSVATGTIMDDEPYANIGDASVMEGDEGTASLIFNVTLTAPSEQPVTVSYVTVGSSAGTNVDYQQATGSVTFAPGVTSMPVTILVNGDRLAEWDENLYVNLTGATGARLSDTWATGTIRDNEPRVSINSQSIVEGHKGTKAMTFTVTLSNAYDQAVSVNFATQFSSATGSDFTSTSGTLNFAPNQTSKTITVMVKGDRRREWDESFYVVLSGLSGNALISNSTGWGTIVNDD